MSKVEVDFWDFMSELIVYYEIWYQNSKCFVGFDVIIQSNPKIIEYEKNAWSLSKEDHLI